MARRMSPGMKFARIGTVFGLVFLIMNAQPAAAFCTYNNGDKDVTFLTWPAAGDTFKASVGLGNQGKACCNFGDSTCTTEKAADSTPHDTAQCDDIVMFAAPRKIDTDAITSALVKKEVLELLGPTIGVLGGILGLFTGGGAAVAIIAAGAAFTSVGLDTSAAQTDGVDIEPEDKFVKMKAGGAITWNNGEGDPEVSDPEGC